MSTTDSEKVPSEVPWCRAMKAPDLHVAFFSEFQSTCPSLYWEVDSGGTDTPLLCPRTDRELPGPPA